MVNISNPDNFSTTGLQTGTSGMDDMHTSMPDADRATAGQADAPERVQAMAQGAHQTIDRLAAQVKPQVQRLQANLSGVAEQLDARAEQIRVMTDDGLESLRCKVRAKPLTALATALAVGLVVARLSR